MTRVSSGAARATAIVPVRGLRVGCAEAAVGVTAAGRGTREETVGLPGRDLAVARPRAAAVRAPAEAPVRAGAAVVAELVRRAAVGSDQGHAVAPVAEGQASLTAIQQQVALRPDREAEREGVGLGVVQDRPAAQRCRGGTAVVELDPLIHEVGHAILVPVHALRVGQELVQGHAGRERRARRGGRGRGGRCRCDVGSPRRRRVGVGPGAITVGRAAVGAVVLGLRVGEDVHLRGIGTQQPDGVTIVVQRHAGAVAEEHQEAAWLQEGAGWNDVRRTAPGCDVIQEPAAEVDRGAPPVVDFDPLVICVRRAVAVPVDLGWRGQHLVEPQRGPVVRDGGRSSCEASPWQSGCGSAWMSAFAKA